MSLEEALALRDKIALLKELKQFLDGMQYDGEGADEEWVDGHASAIRSVENWLVDKIVELGDEVKERHV